MNLREQMKRTQELSYQSFQKSNEILAMIDAGEADNEKFIRKLESLAYYYESAVIELRNICEANQQIVIPGRHKHVSPSGLLTGSVQVNDKSWIHLHLNMLLPHCRYQPPAYITDTITRLMDDYERNKTLILPRINKAVIVIDEHCDLASRRVFDQDNKGWKAIPNALKGRVIPDDDQFSLNVCLLSTLSSSFSCHIYVLPQCDLGDFFFMRDGGFAMFPLR